MKGITTILLVLVLALASATGYLGYRVATEPTDLEIIGEFTWNELATMKALSPVSGFSVDDVVGEVGGAPFIDDFDREVSISSAVEKIVCLHPAGTETIFALGSDSKLVAVSNAWGSSVTTPENVVSEIESRVDAGELTALALSPEPETVTGLEPDVVFAFGYTLPSYVEAIQNIVPVICFSPTTIEDVLQNIVLIGKIVNKEVEAENLVEEIKSDIDDIASMTMDTARPKVLCEIMNWGGIYTTGKESFVSSLIILAGGEDIGTVVSAANAVISSEYIVDSQPEIIILLDTPWETAATVAERSGWGTIPAVTNGNIYESTAEEQDKIQRPGPRIADGLKILLGIIHPELSE